MQNRFTSPRFWPIWAGYGLLRLISLLPINWAIKLGILLGKAFYYLSPSRRKVAQINLRLCFPSKSESEIDHLIKEHFVSIGVALFETGLSWWKSEANLRKLARVHGLENLHNAVQEGKGVILLSAHFNSLEFGLRLLDTLVDYPLYAVFQANSNPLLEHIITGNRAKNAGGMISHKDIKKMIRILRQNKIVWYAPDQGYKGKYSEIVPFFNVPAASNTATSRLAKISKAKVVPFFVRQNLQEKTWELTILPAFNDFPSDDVIADTLRYHKALETEIEKAPAQYLWIHRRFKGRPAKYPDVYQDVRVR